MAGYGYTEGNAALNQALRSVNHPSYAASDLFIALLESATNAAETGSEVAARESGYTSYARKQVLAETSPWATPASGHTQNNDAITFNQSTGGTSTVTHFAIMDGNNHTSADNLLFFGTLSVSKIVSNGDTPEFAIGELDVIAT